VHPIIANSEVKRRTGFCDVSTLLAYVIVVCNGDFDRIRKKRTSLTWFEEWFLYFEWKYHATNLRQQDMEAAWGIDKRFINQAKDCKAALEMALLHGDQLNLQPPSSRSDIRFTGKQTIHSGAVARDRAGNERGVMVGQ